jgi:hypothetical protein
MTILRMLLAACLPLTLGCPKGGAEPRDDTGLDPPGETGAGETAEPVPTGEPLVRADLYLVGEAEGDRASYGLTTVDDLDGDGLDEVLVGAPGNNTGGDDAGQAYLVLGRRLVGVPSVELATADHRFIGEAEGDGAGSRLGSVGDLDGDALPELLITAYENDDAGPNAGKLYLIPSGALGSPGAMDLGDAAWALVGDGGDHELGVSVAGGADVDGDGVADLAVGALGYGNVGWVHLVSGASVGSGLLSCTQTVSISGEAEGDSAGISSDLLHDVDGDGLADLLVGAYGHDAAGQASGAAYLLPSGSIMAMDGADLSAAAHRFHGEAAGDTAGFAVSGAGDVDGDGLSDLLIGADCAGDAGELSGKAYLILGGGLGATTWASLAVADAELIGEEPGDRAGVALGGAGDVDGDGRADVLVGACYSGQSASNGGKAYLMLGDALAEGGSISLAGARYAWVGTATGDLAGRSVTGGAFLDDDIIPDLLIGATHTNGGGENDVGKAYAIFGDGLIGG